QLAARAGYPVLQHHTSRFVLLTNTTSVATVSGTLTRKWFGGLQIYFRPGHSSVFELCFPEGQLNAEVVCPAARAGLHACCDWAKQLWGDYRRRHGCAAPADFGSCS